jgi:hypothetical protein
MRIEGLNWIAFPGLKIETWGTQPTHEWGTQAFPRLKGETWGTRIFQSVMERSGGRWESHSI